MLRQNLTVNHIPAILWGDRSDEIYIFVHGKMADKESALEFADIATSRGYQVLSFDLPEHGDRKSEGYPCNVWNGAHDLEKISTYAQQNWKQINLFACSLGAYFSLLAYCNLPIKKCLFQSPILDMAHLIHNMFEWYQITAEMLQEKKEISTPIEQLSWDYYCYVREKMIVKWEVPTAILYGSADNFQSRAVVERFTKRFGCELSVAIGSEHDFSRKEQAQIVSKWLEAHI